MLGKNIWSNPEKLENLFKKKNVTVVGHLGGSVG